MSPNPEQPEIAPDVPHETDRAARTRRGFLGALLAALASALAIVIVWLIARGSPSSGRDPAWPPP